MTVGSAGVAIADVTIDACVAENSANHPLLASDMQSLCGLSSSVGGLLGFAISGQLMNALGSKGVLGLLSIPASLVVSVGMVLKEPQVPVSTQKQICEKLVEAKDTMWETMKCSDVWRPCVFMFTSLAVSINIQEGMFYWYTDTESGPSFSQFHLLRRLRGLATGRDAVPNIPEALPVPLAPLLDPAPLQPRGFLDLALLLRLNRRLRMPDPLFAVADEGVSQLIGRVRWMPLLVLSARLCPGGVEGAFFALLMAVDHAAMLVSSWGGGALLRLLSVSRSEFGNLWVAVVVRNVLRLLPSACCSSSRRRIWVLLQQQAAEVKAEKGWRREEVRLKGC
uniref:Uncharacterized protein n=1 Tax=Ananas comosus var. bracteatus TaxID=296719 RepID=A0A6V7PM91_ANACO|nr:unnamed protein product [Ananas comosus var. bracteatus]